MKRAREPAAERPKRQKTNQACSACRRHKTRCEVAADPTARACHRCSVLALPCSFESEPPLPQAPQPGLPQTDASGSSGARAPQRSPPRVQAKPNTPAVVPEDLVFVQSPFRPRAPGDGDWVETPMTAMYDLLRRRKTAAAAAGAAGSGTQGILSAGQITRLLDVFETHYAPWVDLPVSAPPSVDAAPPSLNDFYTLARCAVACRHLRGPAHSSTQPRLQRAAEHAVLLHTFDPASNASADAVRALIVLAAWAPAVGALRAEVQDGALIAAGAVRMALALRLDMAAERALEIRAQQPRREGVYFEEEEEDETGEYAEAMSKARLWNALCNVEWTLCAGTWRSPLSRRTTADYAITDWRLIPETLQVRNARDYRLGVVTVLAEATHMGRTKTLTNMTQFSAEIDKINQAFTAAQHAVLPQCPMTCERLQMDALTVREHSCRLLVMLHALAQLRQFVGGHTKEMWMAELERSGNMLVSTWGMTLITSAQAVLTGFLDMTDRAYPRAEDARRNAEAETSAGTSPAEDSSPPADADAGAHTPAGSASADEPRVDSPLSTAPDHFFASILLAASLLLIARYSMVHQWSVHEPALLFTPPGLLARLAERLDALAAGAEHAPAKCAEMARELRRVWADQVVSKFGARAAGMRAQVLTRVRMPPRANGVLAWHDMCTVEEDAQILQRVRAAAEKPADLMAMYDRYGTDEAHSAGGAGQAQTVEGEEEETARPVSHGGAVSVPVSAERSSVGSGSASAHMLASPASAPVLPDGLGMDGGSPFATFDYSAAPMPDAPGITGHNMAPDAFIDNEFWSLFLGNIGPVG